LKSPSRQCGLWVALLVLAGLTAPAAQARTHHSDAWAREHFATADRMREALNGRPAAERTRRDYQRVLNAYRTVYLGAPASTKADPSVVAVAETLVEMGRRFDDDKILNNAIEQYKFLRREYPGSKYRFDALFTVGEIYKDDLNDPEAARSTFQEFLRRYPHNRLADGAREAIADLSHEAQAEKVAESKSAERAHSDDAKNSIVSKDAKAARIDHAVPAASPDTTSAPRSARLPRVTAIRHWSTPDYTRVAIDVEKDIKFSSQRIDSPSRIFFDLRDTKLASTLVGKSFDVDDGFLKKVRVAQFAPGRTRVVLEVDSLSDYNAFLLPNPYRLIIDIHGRESYGNNPPAKQTKNTDKDAAVEVTPLDDESVAYPKATSDLDSGSNESAENSASAAAPRITGKTVSASVTSDAAASQSRTTVPARKPPTSVVKKIVEAADDVETADAPAEVTKGSPKNVKREPSPARVTVVAKNPVMSDLDSDRSQSASDLSAREARPMAHGDRSLIRALGLKIGKIVIDPGHGGHDTGTIGPDGLEEKDLVLDVARRLGKLLDTRLGAEVVYTRKDDTFIPLETRTAVANQARADLFVSIHANSSHDPGARGVETYYLNFTSSPEALEVAARENAVSEKSIYELQDLVKKIALKEKIEESREFAGDVQASLHSGLAVKSPAIRNRGVKKAPFIVLIGANMPSILAEISFVSNPTDEHRLATGEYRQRIAESLYRGIAKYVNGLSGVKVASKMDKATGQ
jgi:N-acetylmuramoyl-L-alanine amidase